MFLHKPRQVNLMSFFSFINIFIVTYGLLIFQKDTAKTHQYNINEVKANFEDKSRLLYQHLFLIVLCELLVIDKVR